MDNDFILEALEENWMTNVEQGMNIYHLLTQVVLLDIPGEVVELGCHAGLTTVLMKKTMNQLQSNKQLHVYDSFEGLPEKTQFDGELEMFEKGSCKSAKETLIQNFTKFHLELPHIHEGWFKDTLPTRLPPRVCFAHLDGDFYTSIKESLEYVYPRLSKGAVVIIDDYCDPEVHGRIMKKLNKNKKNESQKLRYAIFNLLPGVKKACDEFFTDKPEKVAVLISGFERHGYFRKL
jgi:O-methyltransferase